jgi:hypothetical protein
MAKCVAEEQYSALRSALSKSMQRPGWLVKQVSFIADARSLNEEERKENLEFFKVPKASMESIRSKLAMKIFDEYANILKGMYSMRFFGRSVRGHTNSPSSGAHTSPY